MEEKLSISLTLQLNDEVEALLLSKFDDDSLLLLECVDFAKLLLQF